MTKDEFQTLKDKVLTRPGWRWAISPSFFVKYTSSRSKYSGSILEVIYIEKDNIRADCSISGAPKIYSNSHYRNFELTNETSIKYIDAKMGIGIVKDFFNDDINIGDYVFGEFNRAAIFGIVRGTKIADNKRYRGYSSKINEFDSAMVEIVKIELRDGNKPHIGDLQLLEMKYFIKVEDPTLYLLKL